MNYPTDVVEGTLDHPAAASHHSNLITISVDSSSDSATEQDHTDLIHDNTTVEELSCATDDNSDTETAGGTKRSSPSCSSAAKRQRQRKREQDKMAASKYRHRKKQEILALDDQQTKLEHENSELVKQVKSAEEEIVMLKSLLREIYAPCNHSNPTNTIPQSSSNSSLPAATVATNNSSTVTASDAHVMQTSTAKVLLQSSRVTTTQLACNQSDQAMHSDRSSLTDRANTATSDHKKDLFAVIWNELFPPS